MTARGRKQDGRPGDHRGTPPAIWSVVLDALARDRFDMDPATNPWSSVPARSQCYGTDPAWAVLEGVEIPRHRRGSYRDGLQAHWLGDVWLNPPFSDAMPWARKYAYECQIHGLHAGRLGLESICALVPGDNSTAWWRTMEAAADLVIPWPRREHFELPGGAPKGSAPMALHVLAWFADHHRRSAFERRIRSALDCPVYQSLRRYPPRT